MSPLRRPQAPPHLAKKSWVPETTSEVLARVVGPSARALEPQGTRALEPHSPRALEPHGARALEPHGTRAIEPHGTRAIELDGARAVGSEAEGATPSPRATEAWCDGFERTRRLITDNVAIPLAEIDAAALAAAPRASRRVVVEALLDPSKTAVSPNLGPKKLAARIGRAAGRLLCLRPSDGGRRQVAGALTRSLSKAGDDALYGLAEAHDGVVAVMLREADTVFGDPTRVARLVDAVVPSAVEAGERGAVHESMAGLDRAGDAVQRYFEKHAGKSKTKLLESASALFGALESPERFPPKITAARVGVIIAGALKHAQKTQKTYAKRAEWSRNFADLFHVISGQFVWPAAVTVVGLQILYAHASRPDDLEGAIYRVLGALEQRMMRAEFPPEVFLQISNVLHMNGLR